MVFVRILIFILTLAAGLSMIIWTNGLVQNIGRSAWAETKIGVGGTYTMWKIIGIIIIIFGFLVLLYGGWIGI